MKKHSLYKWFRRVVMFSGIPALTIVFACCKKYGPPSDVVWSEALNEETNLSVPEVVIQEGDSNLMNDAPSLP